MPKTSRYHSCLLRCYDKKNSYWRMPHSRDGGWASAGRSAEGSIARPVKIFYFEHKDNDLKAHISMLIPNVDNWPCRYVSFGYSKAVRDEQKDNAGCSGVSHVCIEVNGGNSFEYGLADLELDIKNKKIIYKDTVHKDYEGESIDVRNLDVRAMHAKLDNLLGAQKNTGVLEDYIFDRDKGEDQDKERVRIQPLSGLNIDKFYWNCFGGSCCSPREQNCSSIVVGLLKEGGIEKISNYGKGYMSKPVTIVFAFLVIISGLTSLVLFFVDRELRKNETILDSTLEQVGLAVAIVASFFAAFVFLYASNSCKKVYDGTEALTRPTGVRALVKRVENKQSQNEELVEVKLGPKAAEMQDFAQADDGAGVLNRPR